MLLAQTNRGPCRGRTDERGLNPCDNSKSYCRGSREFQGSQVAISKALRMWKEDWGVHCRYHVAEPGPTPRMQKACLCAHMHACTRMEELPHRHVTRVSAYVRLHLLFWLPVLGTSPYYACVHMSVRTHLCVWELSACLRVCAPCKGGLWQPHLYIPNAAPGTRYRNGAAQESRKGITETGCLRHLRRNGGFTGGGEETWGVRGALQARETTCERARVLCWPGPRSHRHQVQPGGDHSNPWWGSKRHCAHVTSRQRLLSRCPVTETPIFGGGVHWGTLYNCELSNFHFQRHIHHQYSTPKRTIQTQPTS